MRKIKLFQAFICISLCLALLISSSTTTHAVRSISEIQKEQDSLQDEIDQLDSELYSLVSQVTELEQAISSTEAEIESTQEQLQEAQVACDEQYASMKVRIQYMYEKEDTSVFQMLLESGSITDFLNKVEYVNGVYEYDRQKLEQFQATQAEIEELAQALQDEMTSLESSKSELVTQEAALDNMISQKQGELDDLDAELKEAREIAAREAALRAAQAAQSQANVATTVSGASSKYNVTGDLNPGKTTGISGSDVVAYANQFVGNPYVWGGTSLTEGADCSGFVMQVFANFGISWGTRMTSGSFRSVGSEVSYDYMQPGDIICYAGHVAIYQGGGTIVEAQSTAAGITNNRVANCHPIICIRRVL